jgi:hypothetical protein
MIVSLHHGGPAARSMLRRRGSTAAERARLMLSFARESAMMAQTTCDAPGLSLVMYSDNTPKRTEIGRRTKTGGA